MTIAQKSIRFTIVNEPAWVSSIAVGKWARISGASPDLSLSATNNLSNVTETGLGSNVLLTSGVSVVIENYGSAIIASGLGTYGAYMPWNGGHNDFAGNAVYKFDLGTRTWSRIKNSYASVTAGSWTQSGGIWGDGTPVIPHTFNALQYRASSNDMVSCLLEQSNSFNPICKPALFNLDTLTWRYCSASPYFVPDGPILGVYDSVRDCLWIEGGAGGSVLSKYTFGGSDGTSGTWDNSFVSINGSRLDTVGAIAPVGGLDGSKDIMVVTDFSNSTNIYGFDPSAPSTSVSNGTALTQSGRPTVDGRHAWDWSTALGGFIYHRGGSNVYKVVKTSGTWNGGTYTWTNLLNGGNTVTGPTYSAGSAGPYQKMRLARWGTKEVLIGQLNYTDPVYAFRLN